MLDKKFNRRNLLTKSGALIVGFSFAPAIASVLASAAPASASPVSNPALDPVLTIDDGSGDSWLVIDASGNTVVATVYSGKVELGTGVETALSQIVADELYLDFSQIVGFVQGDTSLTPNQGYTAGSNTIYVGGVQLRQAAATAFQQLLQLASQQIGVAVPSLRAQGGMIGVGHNLNKALTYAQVLGSQQIQIAAEPERAGQRPEELRRRRAVGAPSGSPRQGLRDVQLRAGCGRTSHAIWPRCAPVRPKCHAGGDSDVTLRFGGFSPGLQKGKFRRGCRDGRVGGYPGGEPAQRDLESRPAARGHV